MELAGWIAVPQFAKRPQLRQEETVASAPLNNDPQARETQAELPPSDSSVVARSRSIAKAHLQQGLAAGM